MTIIEVGSLSFKGKGMDISQQAAWNHFYEVVCIFVLWTATMATVMKGKQMLWDFDKYPEDEKHK